MKTSEDLSFFKNRRMLLFAMLTSPFLLSSYSLVEKNTLPVAVLADSEEFLIINGWVLLKQDVSEQG